MSRTDGLPAPEQKGNAAATRGQAGRTSRRGSPSARSGGGWLAVQPPQPFLDAAGVGGKLELGEEPPVCVAREITEETGLPVTTGPILDAWHYHIREGRDVLIVTYGCYAESSQSPTLSNEHKEIGFFTLDEVGNLNMPAGYRHSIRSWFARLTGADDNGA